MRILTDHNVLSHIMTLTLTEELRNLGALVIENIFSQQASVPSSQIEWVYRLLKKLCKL